MQNDIDIEWTLLMTHHTFHIDIELTFSILFFISNRHHGWWWLSFDLSNRLHIKSCISKTTLCSQRVFPIIDMRLDFLPFQVDHNNIIYYYKKIVDFLSVNILVKIFAINLFESIYFYFIFFTRFWSNVLSLHHVGVNFLEALSFSVLLYLF